MWPMPCSRQIASAAARARARAGRSPRRSASSAPCRGSGPRSAGAQPRNERAERLGLPLGFVAAIAQQAIDPGDQRRAISSARGCEARSASSMASWPTATAAPKSSRWWPTSRSSAGSRPRAGRSRVRAPAPRSRGTAGAPSACGPAGSSRRRARRGRRPRPRASRPARVLSASSCSRRQSAWRPSGNSRLPRRWCRRDSSSARPAPSASGWASSSAAQALGDAVVEAHSGGHGDQRLRALAGVGGGLERGAAGLDRVGGAAELEQQRGRAPSAARSASSCVGGEREAALDQRERRGVAELRRERALAAQVGRAARADPRRGRSARRRARGSRVANHSAARACSARRRACSSDA